MPVGDSGIWTIIVEIREEEEQWKEEEWSMEGEELKRFMNF